MKKSPLKVFTDRLKDEEVQAISETIPSSLLQAEENELHFDDSVSINGKAYLASDHLVIDLKISATAKMPCIVCNEEAPFSMQIQDFTHTVALEEIPSAVYDYTEEVRSAILLKIPQFFECHEGKCPTRGEVKKYLKEPGCDTHSPFSDLNL
jgi:uncharacterized metal-binding protein YceD (DUF177 family)